MAHTRNARTRWPKGTWMRLISKHALRLWMEQKDVSLQDLANSAEVSKGFISHLTAGRKSTMTPKVAVAIARRLDVPLETLFVPSISSDTTQPVKQGRKAA